VPENSPPTGDRYVGAGSCEAAGSVAADGGAPYVKAGALSAPPTCVHWLMTWLYALSFSRNESSLSARTRMQ
jgi:hypothetical protein